MENLIQHRMQKQQREKNTDEKKYGNYMCIFQGRMGDQEKPIFKDIATFNVGFVLCNLQHT